jgi:hypothetical protein
MHNFDEYYSHCDDNLLGNEKIELFLEKPVCTENK